MALVFFARIDLRVFLGFLLSPLLVISRCLSTLLLNAIIITELISSLEIVYIGLFKLICVLVLFINPIARAGFINHRGEC